MQQLAPQYKGLGFSALPNLVSMVVSGRKHPQVYSGLTKQNLRPLSVVRIEEPFTAKL